MLKSSFWLTLLTLLISLISFVNQVIIAHYFGAGQSMDLYLTCSSVPVLIGAIFSTALSYSLTPHLLKKQIILKKDDYGIYATSLLVRILMIVLIVIIFVGVALNALFYKLYPTFSNVDTHIIYTIQIVCWLSTIFSILQIYFTCFFNAKSKFIFPVVLSMFPYCGAILVIASFQNRLGITSIPIGMFCGTFTASLLIFFMAMSHLQLGPIISTEKKSQVAFIKKMPLVMIAMLCFTIYQSIDAFWVTKLGTSMLSYMGYCQRILIALGALVITGPSTVIIPRLTKSVVEKRELDFFEDVSSLIFIVVSFASIIALLGSVLSKPLVSILFERGAFNNNDTHIVSEILPFMLIGMVFMLTVVLLFRVLFIKEMYRTVAFTGITVSILYFSLSGVALTFNDIRAFGVAYIAAWVIAFFIATLSIYKRNVLFFFNKQLLVFVLRLSSILLLIKLILGVIVNYYNADVEVSLMHNILELAIIGSLGIALFILLSVKILVLTELKVFYDSISKLIFKR